MTTGHLHSLCRQGSVSKIQSYLEEAEDIHNKLEERIGFLGYTPLHEAAKEGRLDVVRLLLENGANANAEANGQYTPLHIAASMDDEDCVVELLKHNADVAKKDEFDKTPYRTAIIMKCKKAAKILKTEEIKRAARENSPNLKDLLASISRQDILPSCFKEALLEASSCGHVDAICSLVVAGAKMPLYLKDCVIQALRLDFCEAAATLLMCYAAKHDKRRLLKYLMGGETSREEGEQAILELPCPSVPRNTMAGIRLFIANKEVFPTAVPLELALQHRRKEAAEIILLNTECDRQRRQVDWGNLAMSEIEPAWLENIKWVETILLVSNFLQRVPDNIHILDKLSCLDLRKNQLKTIPVCLLEMPSLCNLWLSENKIAELPKQCNWSSSLKTLDLNDNVLQALPKSMAKAKLTSLHVARNNLYHLPPWIEQMASLQLLDVSGNPRLRHVPQKLEKLNQTKSDSLIGENHQEADLSDLDKLYLAMAEVGTELNFNILVYSLGITSINALKDYKSKDSVILHPDEVNGIKKKLVNTSFKFDQLAQKYQQSNVVKTCQMKGIPVIRKQDIVVTRTITCGQMAGYVCEAEWTKPGGIKEKVCLRYGETEKQLFLHEAEMANGFRHECILDFHGVVIASSFSPYVALVEEFAEYGNLDKASEHHSVERLCRFTVQAASALEYLESKNVVHQLLQLYCMVVSDYQLKLAGIGYCEFLNDARRKHESGIPYSLPEEVVYIFAKLFSTAFISYQNQAPGFEAAEAVMDTSQNIRSKHGYLCPSHFCEVFDRCLRDNPKERPSFSEISQSLMAIENPLKVEVKRSFNAESAGFLSGETGELITLISKDRHREEKNVWLGETQSKEVGFFTAENVEEVPVSELTEDSSVPPEILARGPRAQRAYERALQIGKVKVYRGRIMILGQDRAGKTSLKKSLLGLPFNPEENSTIGVEVDPSRCELEVAQIKNWEPTERKKLDVSDFAEDMAKLVARDLNETVDQQNVSDFAEDMAKLVASDLNDIVDQQNVSTAGSPSEEELLHNNLPNAAATVVAAAATATESTPDTIMVKEMEQESSDECDLENSYQAELNIGGTSVVPNDVTELVVRYLKNLKLEEDIKAKEVVLTLWDFAGQHLYYASHSVFLSRRAIYILVYNLHKSICAKAEPRVRQGTHDVVLDNPNNETNLDHLLSWLVSVHAIVPQADQVGKDLNSQATSVPYLRPPVIIVGTNADQPFEDPRATEKCIQRSVSGKTYEKHLIRPFFAVDNTKSNKDLGVQELRRKIVEVLNQEPYMGEEVPLRWFNFEKVVEALVAKGTYYMDLNELLTVTRQVCRIYDGDELTAMLNFYHDLGVIVKHGQTVVLQAQWLIDLFKQLITVRPFDEVDPMFSEYWLELEQSGILRMALVDHIFAEFIQEGLSKQDILDMMEVYGLIIKFSCSAAESEQEQTEYFVPSQLRSSPSGLCELKPSASDPCPLYLHFLDGFLPNGFFPQLLSKCIHWCSKQRLKGPPRLFQNGARLFIGVHDIFELILLCRKRFIKVLLKKKNPSNSSAATCATRLMANKVRDSLEETLQSLSRELSWLCNLRYELCVLCTSCLQSSEPCTKHGLVSCDDDDCQHLLRVLPGEELCCLRSFCDYTVKVQGLDVWFLITTAYKAKMENGTAEASPVLDPHIGGSFAASTSVEDKVVMDRTLSFKSGVPSSSDLLLVASGLGSSWKMLGRILCLPEPVLEQIEEDERHLPEKCYAVLKKWIQTVGPAASYGCLAKALQHPIVRRSELATKYCHSFRETVPQLIHHNCAGADHIWKMQAKCNRYDRNLVSRQRRGSLAVYALMNSNKPAKEFTAFRRRISRISNQKSSLSESCGLTVITDCKFVYLMLENVATQKTDSHLSDPQDSVDMVKNNKEVGLQCSLNSGDMKDRESVLSKEET